MHEFAVEYMWRRIYKKTSTINGRRTEEGCNLLSSSWEQKAQKVEHAVHVCREDRHASASQLLTRHLFSSSSSCSRYV